MVGRWAAVKVHGLSVSLSSVWVKMARLTFEVGRAGPHSFRQWSGVRRQGRPEVDHGGRGEDGLHCARIAMGKRLYRVVQRTAEG